MADIFDTASNLLQQSPLGQATKQVLGGLGQVVKAIPKEVIDNFKKLAPIPAPVKYPDVPAIHNTSDAVIKPVTLDFSKAGITTPTQEEKLGIGQFTPISERGPSPEAQQMVGLKAADAIAQLSVKAADKIGRTVDAFATDPIGAMNGVYAGFNKALYDAAGNIVGLFNKQTGENIKRETSAAFEKPLSYAGKETQDVGYLAFQALPYGYINAISKVSKFPAIIEPILNGFYAGISSNDEDRWQAAGLAAGLTGLFNYMSGSPVVNPQFKSQVDDAFNTLGITPETKGGIKALTSEEAVSEAYKGVSKRKLELFRSIPRGTAGEQAAKTITPELELLEKFSPRQAADFLQSNPLASKIVQLGERYNILPSKVVDIIEQEIKLLPSGSNIMDHATKTQEILNNPEPFLQKYAMATGGKDQFGKMTMLKPKEGGISAMPSVTDLGVSIPAAIPTATSSPLLAEAKKYSTPEDFIKAIDDNQNTVFHGTKNVFDKFNSKVSKVNGRLLGDGTYFSKDKKIANQFSKEGRLLRSDISRLKLYDISKEGFTIGKDYKMNFVVPEKILKNANKYGIYTAEDFLKLSNNNKKLFNNILFDSGYDGVITGGLSDKTGHNILVFDASNITPHTTSDLTSIWNQAHGKTPTSLPTATELPDGILKNRELVRSISSKFPELNIRVAGSTLTGKRLGIKQEKGLPPDIDIYVDKFPESEVSKISDNYIKISDKYAPIVQEGVDGIYKIGDTYYTNSMTMGDGMGNIVRKPSGLVLEKIHADSLRSAANKFSEYKVVSDMPTATGGRPIQPGDISKAAEMTTEMKNQELTRLDKEYMPKIQNVIKKISSAKTQIEVAKYGKELEVLRKEFEDSRKGLYITPEKATPVQTKKPQTMYRWTGDPSKKFAKDNIFNGLYVSSDKEKFSYLGGHLQEYTIPGNLNIKQIEIGTEEFSNAVLNRGNTITDKLKSEGYDGVRIVGSDGKEVETIIFDNKNIISKAAEEKAIVKTGEQLENEYKAALVKPTGKEVPITFNINKYREEGEAIKELVKPEEMTRQVKPDKLLQQEAEQILSTKGALDKILSSKVATDNEIIALTNINRELQKRRAELELIGQDTTEISKQLSKLALKHVQLSTEAGRTLRATGDITDLKFDDPAFWYRKATAVKGSELTPEEIGKVSTMVDQAKQSDNAKYALLQYVSDLEPHSLIQKLAELRKAGMLSGLKTHIRNILGNTIFAGAENIKQPISVAMDKLASLYSGKISVAMPSLKEQAKGAVKGLKEGIGDYKKGFTTTNVATQYEIPRSLANKPNTIPGKFVRIVYGALQTEDRIAFTSALNDSISQQARVMVKNGYNDTVQNLIANPTQEMQTDAIADALYRTFQDDNKAVHMMKGIKKAMDKLGVDNVGLGELILPFPKTPTNILNRMVAYSPLGTIKVMRDAYKFFRSPDYNNQKKFVEGFGRVLVGSTVAAISAYLASQGIITGKEKDYEKSKIEQRIGGGNYKINISALTRLINGQSTEWQQGDNVASYDWALPMSGLAVFGSNLGMRDIETAGEGMDATINSLIEQPLLKGVKTLIAKQSDKWSGVTDTLNSLASSLVPSFIGQFKGFTDNASRDIQTPVDALMSRIPGLSNIIRPKLDEFGRPVTYQEDPNPFFKAFNVLLNPAIATYYDPQTQKVEQELLDIDYNFSVPTENITLSNKETKEKLPVTLDKDMYYDYQKALGARKLKVAEALIESDEYKSQPVDERKKIFMNYMQEAAKDVKEFYALKQLKKDGRLSEYKDWKAIYGY